MSVKKYGDWDLARLMTSSLKSDIDAATKVALKRIGLETERKVVKYIKRQPKTWPPLSPAYRTYKSSQGYSTNMLRKTGDYINSINSQLSDNNRTVFIGAKKASISKQGESYALIAAVLEFGSRKRNIPARPHFSPVNRVMKKKIVSEQTFARHVYHHLQRKYHVL